MVGLDSVKDEFDDLVAEVQLVNRKLADGRLRERPAMHMLFAGSPGTGKTTVARLMSEALYHMGAVRKPEPVVISNLGDVMGQYLGDAPKLAAKEFAKAKGGVLYIDEVHSLVTGDQDMFGKQVLTELVKFMEDNRQDTVVILSGYDAASSPDRNVEQLFRADPGLRSRIRRVVDFADYSPDEMVEIMRRRVRDEGYAFADAESERVAAELARALAGPGNARRIRNAVQDAERGVARRMQGDPGADYVFTAEDWRRAAKLAGL